MASELRVNTSTNRVGLGTITYTDTGPIVSGITTASNFKTGTSNVHSTGYECTNINASGIITATTFSGAFTGDVTGAASQITVADESSDTSAFVVFANTATGNNAPKTGSNLTFNSATGALNATSFNGDFVGGSVFATSGAFTGNIDLNSDTNKLKIGAGDDFQFFHNGSNNFIETNNGDIRIKTSDSSGNLTFTAGGSTESARITSAGLFGINCTPSKQLQVKGTDVAFRLESTAATGRIGMEFYDTSAQKGFFGYPSSGNDHMSIQQNEAADLYFYVNGGERLRIDSGGRLLIGHTSSQEVYGTNKFQIQGTSSTTSGMSLLRHGGSPYLTLGSTGGSSLGAVNALSSGNRIGQITFAGADGTDVNTHSASIAAYVDGSVSSNAVPGRIVFATSTGASEVERMRITSNGFVGINEDNPQTRLNVRGCISTGRNVAREVGTIIDISSSYSGSRNGVQVINGQKNYEENSNADWITANGQRVNANLTIDLGAQYTCDRFVIYNQNEYTNNVREVKHFTLEGSNDKSSWTTLLDDECGASYAHEPNPGFSFRIPSDFTDDDEGATFRYWRFTMKDYHGSTTLGGVMELELYEVDSSNKTISEVSTHHLSAMDITAQNIYHDLPAFFACKTSSLSISNQTNTVLAFTTTQGPGFDTNGSYDNSNYRFNPKIPGYYQINMCCSVSYGALQAGQIYIYKNGSPYAFSQLYFNSGDNYDDICLTISTLVHLDGQSDYLEARAWRNGGNGGLGSGFSDQQWSGYLVRHAGYRRHGDGV